MNPLPFQSISVNYSQARLHAVMSLDDRTGYRDTLAKRAACTPKAQPPLDVATQAIATVAEFGRAVNFLGRIGERPVSTGWHFEKLVG
jgi:hypothetical protein